MRMGRTILVVATLAVTGCSMLESPRLPSGRWESTTKPWEEWSRDEAECRELAKERAEREFLLDRESRANVPYSRAEPFTQAADTFSAGRRRDRLFERCMQDRGYRWIERETKPDPEKQTVPAT
jgi:hypothetical protein